MTCGWREVERPASSVPVSGGAFSATVWTMTDSTGSEWLGTLAQQDKDGNDVSVQGSLSVLSEVASNWTGVFEADGGDVSELSDGQATFSEDDGTERSVVIESIDDGSVGVSGVKGAAGWPAS